MSFVYLGGDESTTPTYIEVVAAERLVPSLKAAVIYSLSVLSQRHSWVHHLLGFDDEVVALVTLLLDWHSLVISHGSFAESLYGLRRAAACPNSDQSAGLSRKQLLGSLACQVLLPYVHAKLEKKYKALSGRNGRGVLGLAIRYAGNQRQLMAGNDSTTTDDPSSTSMSTTGISSQQRSGLSLWDHTFVKAYPWLHASTEAAVFAYHVSFMMGASRVHSPVLHALGLRMARVSAQDMAATDKQAQAARAARDALLTALLTRAGCPSVLIGAARGVLQGCHAVSQHARSGLILGVFAFKALEWWYSSGEDKLAASKALPPPPPPPPPLPSPQGVGLPADPRTCPVCRRARTNPCIVATSGYCFCYPCAFNYVLQHGACPVTRLPAGLDHIRKLYEAT